MGLFAIVLHYAFTYVGLSLTESSKTAILKQLGALIYVCFAFLFIKGEKFGLYKITGAVVGFCGIIAINAEGGINSPTIGDVLIVLAHRLALFSIPVFQKAGKRILCSRRDLGTALKDSLYLSLQRVDPNPQRTSLLCDFAYYFRCCLFRCRAVSSLSVEHWRRRG